AGAVCRALASLRASLAEDERQLPAWQQIERDWQVLQAQGLQLERAANFHAHTELVAQLLRLQIQLADAYGLSFDPDEASFYLMTAAINRLPFLLERFGRLRAQGSGALAQGHADSAQRIALSVLNEEIRSAMLDVEAGLAKVAEQRPELRLDRKSTRLNSSHVKISYAVFCLKKKKIQECDWILALCLTLRSESVYQHGK